MFSHVVFNAKISCDPLDILKQSTVPADQIGMPKKHPDLINGKCVFLQHDNTVPHVAKVIQQKIREIGLVSPSHPL